MKLGDEGTTYKDKSARDPVHGNLLITPIEQLIIDRPEFHRLHFVSQQSIAYLTFPSNRTSRFSHSLGATHIAGKLFKRCVENSPSYVLALVARHAREAVEDYARIKCKITITDHDADHRLEKAIQELRQVWSMFSAPPSALIIVLLAYSRLFLTRLMRIDAEYRSWLNLLWQAVRLATLLHDIGHLPLSHLFEEAIEEAIDQLSSDVRVNAPLTMAHAALSERYGSLQRNLLGFDAPDDVVGKRQFHELIGFLIDTALPVWREQEVAVYEYAMLFAQCILAAPSPSSVPWDTALTGPQQLFCALHTLVSGELDADRLDYCIRDPFSAGVESSGIDAESIIGAASFGLATRDFVYSGCTVTEQEVFESAANDQRLLVVFDSRALDAIEGFFFSRFHSFRRVASDHNAARFYSIAKHAVYLILRHCANCAAQLHSGRQLDRLEASLYRVLQQDGWTSEANSDGEEFGPKSKMSDSTRKMPEPFISPESITRYDDAWFRTSLGNVLRLIHRRIRAQLINSGGPDLGRESGDERPLGIDTDEFSKYLGIVGSLPREIRELYLCASALQHRRLDQVYSVLKTSADAQSLNDEIVDHLNTRVLSTVLGRKATKRDVRDAKEAARSLTVCIRLSKRRKAVLRDEIAKCVCRALQKAIGVEHAAATLCLVHTTATKLPPHDRRMHKSRSGEDLMEAMPRLWIRQQVATNGAARLLPAVERSPFLAGFADVAGGPYLRVTLVGQNLRDRLGTISPELRMSLHAAVMEAIVNVIGTRILKTMEESSP